MADVEIRTELIPQAVRIHRSPAGGALDLQAICAFVATGFFLGTDTYFRGDVALQPATDYSFGADGSVRATPYWAWHYSPREITLAQATDEFADSFERIVASHASGKRVILPLSGGLDSRTLAAALRGHPAVHAYSYELAGGLEETRFGADLAAAIEAPFEQLSIPKGYLWSVIDELARLNRCESEFTHPRQMAVIDRVSELGDVFALGHWGDVLFSGMAVPERLSFEGQIATLLPKLVRRGGCELASALWDAWGLGGRFEQYLHDRVAELLAGIRIDHAGARLRAFKSMYWAPRWTSVNLVAFSSRREIAVPYYSPEVCELVCTLPERHLAGRQIQIEYLKRRAPELARLAWQTYDPLDLYTYRRYRTARMIPYRAWRKLQRTARTLLTGRQPIVRNWELQFLGADNDAQLRARLFADEGSRDLVPPAVVERFYRAFVGGRELDYAHPISMLLVLSRFATLQRDRARVG